VNPSLSWTGRSRLGFHLHMHAWLSAKRDTRNECLSSVIDLQVAFKCRTSRTMVDISKLPRYFAVFRIHFCKTSSVSIMAPVY
jgi:hypothetical protein